MSTGLDLDLMESGRSLQGFGVSGATVSGSLKTFQKYVTAFTTELGTNVYDADMGTAFMQELKDGFIRTDFEVDTRFREASAAAISLLTARLEGDEPDNEVLETAELTTFGVDADGLILYVKLVMRSGDVLEGTLTIST